MRETSQKAGILEDLMAGRRVTALDALERHGCFRLSSVIHRLRKDGHDVKTELVQAQSGAVHAVYYMVKTEVKQTNIFDEITNQFWRNKP